MKESLWNCVSDIQKVMSFLLMVLFLLTGFFPGVLKAQDGSDILYANPGKVDSSFVGDYVHLDFLRLSFHGRQIDTIRLTIRNKSIRFIEHRVDNGFNNWFGEQYLQSMDRVEELDLRITKSRIDSVSADSIWVTNFVEYYSPGRKDQKPVRKEAIRASFDKRLIGAILISEESYNRRTRKTR